MKNIDMKRNRITSWIAAAAILLSASGVVSCVGDLDVEPIDPSVTTTFDQNKVFTKIYATLGLTGIEGPTGSGDVDGLDEGSSEFYRLLWNMNELPADEVHCCWTDGGMPELVHGSWDASHKFVTGLYYRLYFDITLCNFFLEQIDGKTDAESVTQRAEARFIRALNYYYLIDMYGKVPFVTKVSTDSPSQVERAELFKFIEKELLEASQTMKEPRTNTYGRADKAAAWLLLARLYLNAEVYTGTPQWAKASEYAQKVIKSSYTLCPVYKHLFMADNNGSSVNKANTEIILPIIQDGATTRNYGGSFFLIASTHKTDDMPPFGTTDGWAGNRCRPQLVSKFFPNGNAPTTGDVDAMTKAAGDDRALFFSKDRTLSIDMESEFTNGYSFVKFSNLRADGGTTHDSKFTDTDVPFMRLAEAYLTYAEAEVRQNGSSTAAATEALNTLRKRAHAKTEASYTLNGILDEWAREFAFEGRRRSDLIRFKRFTGNTDYTWQWKGGAKEGTVLSGHLSIYPIPANDLTVNSNLVQNPGY